MSYPNLIIGGIEIPLRSLTGGFSQSYDEIAAISSRRLADGTLFTQRAWPTADKNYKLRTTISGGGILPAPLDALNRAVAHEIQCAEQRRIAAVGNVITLPAGRRAGGIYDPLGFAQVAGELVATPITSLVANMATLTVVPGAQHYQVRYYPTITAVITHRSDGEPWQARRTWVVVAEEV